MRMDGRNDGKACVVSPQIVRCRNPSNPSNTPGSHTAPSDRQARDLARFGTCNTVPIGRFLGSRHPFVLHNAATPASSFRTTSHSSLTHHYGVTTDNGQKDRGWRLDWTSEKTFQPAFTTHRHTPPTSTGSGSSRPSLDATRAAGVCARGDRGTSDAPVAWIDAAVYTRVYM